LAGCAAGANFPAGSAFVCAYAPTDELIAAVARTAIRAVFSWHPESRRRETSYSTEFGGLTGPAGSSPRMYLSSNSGGFGFTIAAPRRGNDFSDDRISLIRKVESDVRGEFHAKFKKCHLDFKFQRFACEVNGIL